MTALTPESASLENARLYAILDTGYVPRARWKATCAALLAGGADLIQLRAKAEDATTRQSLLEEILPLFAESSVPLIINDDLELAARYPEVGLHVGQDDLAPEVARERLGPDRVIGLSTHSPAQAAGAWARSEVLSYFAVGPVFATPTKPTYTPVGLSLVEWVAAEDRQRAREGQARLPWFCIGGVKTHNLAQITAAGATRVVIVSGLLQAEDVSATTRLARQAIAAAA